MVMRRDVVGDATTATAALANPLRHLAELVRRKAVGEAFDFLAMRPELLDRFAVGEYRLGAAMIREAARRPDAGTPGVIDLVTQLGDRIGLPQRSSDNPRAGDYIDALVAWYDAIQDSGQIAQLWDRISRLVRVDFGDRAESRARFISVLAEIGLGAVVPRDIEAEVLASAGKAYLFHFDDRQFLSMLAFQLERALRDGDRGPLAGGPWLIAWCRCLAAAPYTRRRRKVGQRSLMALKAEIHSRIARACRFSDLLLGRFGGLRRSLVLLLIKLDHALFISTGVSTWRQTYPWFVALRWSLLRLVRPRATRTPLLAAPRRGLVVLDPVTVEPAAGDILVTRAQGGLGDVMTIRPGLLELIKRNPGCRVIFATDPAYFPAFSPDDERLCLLDIKRAFLHPLVFERWINLTNCPGARVEVSEFPNIRSNRIKIFADALGVAGLDVGRIPPLRFEPSVDAAAETILRRPAPAGTRTVGIQFRSAETYKDVPALLDAARTLSASHRVFVFYNRSIPRHDGDGFIAVDDQPLPVALALASKLDVLVAPDSSLLHLAGINRIPCLGLFGPTDGTVRCLPYPSVTPFDLRADFDCIPCWRNQQVRCRVTDSADSLCMQRIEVSHIVAGVEKILSSTG
jgi:putative component of toxin-antitoxin plasmid stabilization module